MPNIDIKDSLTRFNCGFVSARIGEWIYTIALNWIVLTTTASPWLLAVVNACRLMPSLLLSVAAGNLADNRCPRRLSLINNLANAAVMLLVGLALHFQLSFVLVVLLVLAQAVLTALEAPFRNTYMNGLFEGQRLKQAVAHNASLMNLGRVIGPVIAGFLLSPGGGLAAFLVAAISTAFFSAVISTLEAAPSQTAPRGGKSHPARVSLRQTLRENTEIRNIMALAVPMMFFGFPYTAMLSVLTEGVLDLGAAQLGALTAVAAIGALVASTILGLKPELANWRSTVQYATPFSLALIGLGAVQNFASAAVVLFMVGYLGQAYRSCSRMHLHEVLPKVGGGRILGLSLMDRGMIPLGGLLLGAIAELASARASYFVMGIGCFLAAAYFTTREENLPR